MTQIITTIIYNLLDSIYIGTLVFTLCYYICKSFINKINNTINDLIRKQDILQKSILKLRNIIQIDDDLSHEQNEQLRKIKDEITFIKRILESNRLDYHSDSDTRVSENQEEDSEQEECSSPTVLNLHIQSHISFPHFFIFNQSNVKQTKIRNNETKFRFISDDLSLISYQLAAFQEVNPGTCMSFHDAFQYVFKYVQRNKITNIAEDSQLCKLFGLNENEDYEYSDANIIKLLKKMLEPHLRKII